MLNDYVVCYTRKDINRIIDVLRSGDYTLNEAMAEILEKELTPGKQSQLFNSPTEPEAPLFRRRFIAMVADYINARQLTREDFEYMSRTPRVEEGDWVGKFWETGEGVRADAGYDVSPTGSTMLWDKEKDLCLFYFQLSYHEIIIDFDLETVKVRLDTTGTSSPTKEQLAWTVWENNDDFLSTSFTDFKEHLEYYF